MQDDWDSIDPDFVDLCNSHVLGPIACEQQLVSNHALPDSRRDLGHAQLDVEGESLQRQVSADREHDRRDSDQLDILGHFDFG